MKKLIAILALYLLTLPARADTATVPLIFNAGVAGIPATVRVVITGKTGIVIQAASNTPGGSPFAESTVIPGEYLVNSTITYTAADLPLREEYYLAGSSPLIAASVTWQPPQTGDSYARLGIPIGASMAADLQAISILVGTRLASSAAPINFAQFHISTSGQVYPDKYYNVVYAH